MYTYVAHLGLKFQFLSAIVSKNTIAFIFYLYFIYILDISWSKGIVEWFQDEEEFNRL